MTSIGPGYIHVYTGSGKGKTTASLGLALRAVGRGLHVLVIQFLKGSEMTGERRAAGRLSPDLEIRPRGRDGFLRPEDRLETDGIQALEALEEASREILGGTWNIVVLDEVNTACSLGLIPAESLVELMKRKPEGVELVLTGRGAPEEVLEAADLVTEMREIKHYYGKGVRGREGIEK